VHKILNQQGIGSTRLFLRSDLADRRDILRDRNYFI